jgi:hypothetical protein
VPKEHDGEKFDYALARVRRCVGGGAEADKADSDSDIEVVADTVSVNLRCPVITLAFTQNVKIRNDTVDILLHDLICLSAPDLMFIGLPNIAFAT